MPTIDQQIEALKLKTDDQIDTSDIPETDFTNAVRGKFYRKPVEGTMTAEQSVKDFWMEYYKEAPNFPPSEAACAFAEAFASRKLAEANAEIERLRREAANAIVNESNCAKLARERETKRHWQQRAEKAEAELSQVNDEACSGCGAEAGENHNYDCPEAQD